MWLGGTGPLILGVGEGPCWVAVGAPPAGQVAWTPWEVAVVAGTPLEVAKCPRKVLEVALGRGQGAVGG